MAPKIYPAQKPSGGSECAIALVGAVLYEQRVDWVVTEAGKDSQIYETRLCMRQQGASFEIVDVVVEGISWVSDLSEEISRFYEQEIKKNAQQSSGLVHQKLLQKLRGEVDKLDEKKPGEKKNEGKKK